MGDFARSRLTGLAVVWALLAVLLSGCSAERLAGWYVTRLIDGYLDLDSEQKSWVRERVDHHIAELKENAVPRAIGLMRRARRVVAEGATDAKIRALQQAFDDLADRVVADLVPDVARLFAKLDDDQIEHFRRELRDDIDESYEDVRAPPAERREEADEKLIDGVEEWTDDLEDWQVSRLLGLVHRLPDERPAAYRASVQRLDEFVALLHRHPNVHVIADALRRMWRTRYDDLGPGRGHDARRAEQRRVLLTIDRMLTSEQRQSVVEEIGDRIRKLRRFTSP